MQLILTLNSWFLRKFVWQSVLLACFVLACSFCLGWTPAAAAPLPVPLFTQPAQPIPPNQLPLVTPLEATTVALHTHTAVIQLADSGNGLTLRLDANYRLDNETDQAVIMVVKISGAPAEEVTQADVVLSANGQPLALFWTDGVGYTAQVQIAAAGQANLQFSYTITLATMPLTTVQYTLDSLRAWRGTPSVGVTLSMPATLRQASWLHITPTDWRYADSASGELAIKWLYDVGLPPTPFVFAFIAPTDWQQLSTLTAAVQSDTTRYRELGELYARLLEATPPAADYSAVRARFYAQALAAYTAGIEALTNTGGATGGAELAALYRGLAALYRSQVAQADGTVNLAYAQALVDAVQQALPQLAPDAAGRAELTQWLADGLQVLLGEAQRREAWPQALALVEELAALPTAVVDGNILAQTKRAITIRQALQLVEENNRDAAIALAGDEIVDTSLLPLPQARTLFRRWEITTTILPQQVRVELAGIALSDQQEAAAVALTDLATRLQSSAASQVTVAHTAVAGAGSQSVGRVVIAAPPSTAFATLAALVPDGGDWVLIATLLRQLQPIVEIESAWLQQQVQLSQPLDLRPAGEAWTAQATALETDAAALEAQAAALNPRDPVQAEQALKARIQAANYRNAAQNWHKLARDSWVAVQLMGGSTQNSLTRSGLLTVASPAQLFTLQSVPSPFGATFVTLLAAVFGILLLSGVLWWLL